MFRHLNFLQVQQRGAQGARASGSDPAEEIESVDDPFFIQTYFLKIVQKSFFGVPEPFDGIAGEI